MITALMNSENRVLWELPSGKPNGNQLLIDPKNDQRERIYQAAQSGTTCWYYATKRLRTNYGKTCGAFVEEREFEKKFSDYKKKLNYIYKVEREAINLFYNISMQVFQTKVEFSPSILDAHVSQIEDTILAKEIHKLALNFLGNASQPMNFENAELSFHAFKRSVEEGMFKKKYKTTLDFLKSDLELTPKEILYDIVRSSFAPEISACIPEKQLNNVISNLVTTLAPKQGLIYLQTGLMNYYFKKLCFARSSWNPEKTIDLIIQDLKIHGPLLAGGMLGTPFYQSAPYELNEKISGHTIMAWKIGAYKDKGNGNCHFIVVVGAEKVLEKKFIYFIDPNDASDPASPAQKIYKISYDRFLSGISDSWNMGFKDIPMEKRGYLIYNPNLPNFPLSEHY